MGVGPLALLREVLHIVLEYLPTYLCLSLSYVIMVNGTFRSSRQTDRQITSGPATDYKGLIIISRADHIYMTHMYWAVYHMLLTADWQLRQFRLGPTRSE